MKTDDTMLDEEGSFYTYPQKNSKVVYSLLGVMTVVALCGVGIFLFVASSPTHSDSKTQETLFIANTVEYQIKITDIKNWTNRTNKMNEWMEFFDTKSKYFSMQDTYAEISSKIEYQLNITNCASDYKVHIEEYIDGHKHGLFGIDMKGNSTKKEEAFYYPLWPSSKYQAKSSQKCERDEYQCDNFFTRSSKVTFSQPKEITTCKDIAMIYPRAFGANSTNLQNSVEMLSQQIWFSQTYSGYLNEDTKYKISFDIKYPTVNGALNEDTIPTKGSWSVRLYSLEDGEQSLWNDDVLKDITSAWLKLINHFGDGYCTVLY